MILQVAMQIARSSLVEDGCFNFEICVPKQNCMCAGDGMLFCSPSKMLYLGISLLLEVKWFVIHGRTMGRRRGKELLTVVGRNQD